MKKIIAYASTLLLALILAGCNLTTPYPRVELSFTVLGQALGSSEVGALTDIVVGTNFVRDTETDTLTFENYTLPQIGLRAQAKPGSIGAYIETYSIEYALVDGEQQLPESGQSSRGVLGLQVDDGIICRETRPEIEPIDCDINSPEAEYAIGDPATSLSFAAISGEMARILGGTVDSYAIIVLEGLDANGNSFSQRLDPLKISYRINNIRDLDPEEEEEELAPEEPAPEEPAPEEPTP